MALRYSGRLVLKLTKAPRALGGLVTYDVSVKDTRGSTHWLGRLGRDEFAQTEDIALDRAARVALDVAHERRASTIDGYTVDHLAGYSAARQGDSPSPWIIRREKTARARTNPSPPKRTKAACAKAGKNLATRKSTRAGKALNACKTKRKGTKGPARRR